MSFCYRDGGSIYRHRHHLIGAFAEATRFISYASRSLPRIRLTRTDRLPTVSATDALANLNDGAKSAVSSGIDALNHALIGTSLADNGGFERGKVAEIWGPSGAGKTALAYVA